MTMREPDPWRGSFAEQVANEDHECRGCGSYVDDPEQPCSDCRSEQPEEE